MILKRIIDKKKMLALFMPLITFALVGGILYGNTLHNDFVYDDFDLIVNNPLIQNLSNAPVFFQRDLYEIPGKEFIKGNYRPLLSLWLAFNYRWWGLENTWGYHLTALLLHIICALLVFSIARLIIQNTTSSFLISLLFLCFPPSTFIVAYKSGVMEALFGAWFLSAFLFFLKFLGFEKRRPFFHLCSVLCFIAALLVKETAVIFPLVIFVFHLLFYNRFLQNKSQHQNFLRIVIELLKSHITFWIILISYFVWRAFLYGAHGIITLPSTHIAHNFPIAVHYGEQLATAIKLIGLYLRLLVFPFPLKADYMLSLSRSFLEPPVLIALFTIVATLSIALRYRKHSPELLFGILWIYLLILPVSNIVYIGNLFAENYLYLPAVGFFLLIGFFIRKALVRKISSGVNLSIAVKAIAFIIIVLYSRETMMRNLVWKDSFSLWKDTVKKSPLSPRAHLNLGKEYSQRGNFKKAIEQFAIVQKLVPTCTEAYYNSGVAYLFLKQYDQALYYFNSALQFNPQLVEAYNNIGVVFLERNKPELAKRYFYAALALNPRHLNALWNLASILLKEKEYQKAKDILKKIIEFNASDTHAKLFIKSLDEKLVQ